MVLPKIDPNMTVDSENYNSLEEKRKTALAALQQFKESILASKEKSPYYFEDQLKQIELLADEHEGVMHEIYYCKESTPESYADKDLFFTSNLSSIRALVKTKLAEIAQGDVSEAMEAISQELATHEAFVERSKASKTLDSMNVVKKKLRMLEDLEISLTSVFKRAHEATQDKARRDSLFQKKSAFVARVDEILNYLELQVEYIEEAQRKSRNKKRRGDESESESEAEEQTKLDMPKTVIPDFDGSIDKWPHFYATFNQLVHNRKIPKIQKFNLLKEHFKPPEKDHVLTEFTVSEEMYEAAWAAVKERYNNPNVLKTVYLHNLQAVKPMSTQSVKEVNRVRDTFSAIITNLSNLKITWDQYLVYTVEKSLDAKTLDEWQNFVGDEPSTWKKLKEFLDQKSTKLVTAASLLQGVKSSSSSHSSSADNKQPKRSFAAIQPSQAPENCVVCSGTHKLHECETFKTKMSRSARLTVVKKHHRCFNCLGANHSIRDCPSKMSCRICSKMGKNGAHHTLLHIDGNEFTPQNHESKASTARAPPHPSSGAKFNRTFEPPLQPIANAAVEHQETTSKPDWLSPSSFFSRYKNVDPPAGGSKTNLAMQMPMSKVDNKIHSDGEDSFCGVLLSSEDEQVVEEVAVAHHVSTHSKTTHYVGHSFKSTTDGSKSSRTMLMPTAVVHMKNESGKIYSVRALLDSGSNTNFMTEHAANVLGLKVQQTATTIETVGSHIAKCNHACVATLSSRYGEFTASLYFRVLPTITGNIPSRQLEYEKMNVPEELFLADPEFYKPKPIQLLLASDLFFFALIGNPRHLMTGAIMMESMFGWLIGGLAPSSTSSSAAKSNLCLATHTGLSSMSLHINAELVSKYEEITKFMEQENFGITEKSSSLTPEEIECQQLYSDTTYREDGGSYVVQLPLKPNVEKLESNFHNALQRQRALDKKRASDAEFNQLYEAYINGMIDDGIVTRVNSSCQDEGFYSPHHGVLRKSSSTTKMRPVFDASCSSKSGLSLNDCFNVGPTVQAESFDIFIRFGQGKYAMKCDLEKMFLKILVEPSQRKYLKMLWAPVPYGPIHHLQFNSVPFGLACSPYLATRTVQQIAIDNREQYPTTADAIENSFYVDDGLFSIDDKSQALKLKTEILKIFGSANMNARKWAASDASLLSDLTADDLEAPDEDDCIKVLGHLWNVKLDTLSIIVKKIDNSKITRASVLSAIASFYDTRGIFGPVILVAKLLLRILTLAELKWDQSPGEEFKNTWVQFCDEMEKLKLVQIPRYFLIDNPVNIQLHGFGDASEKAYGMILYIRSVDVNNNVKVAILCTKTRLAPTKRQQTLARLELCAAVLNATVTDRISSLLTINIDLCMLWTDSTITYHWIHNHPNRYVQYLGNRISMVQQHSTSATWRHTPGYLNPSDLVSRGLWPSEIVDNTFYWNGSFLQQPESEWPESKVGVIKDEEDVELKKEARQVHAVYIGELADDDRLASLINKASKSDHIADLINKCSRYNRVINTFVRIFRWKKIAMQRKLNPPTRYRLRSRAHEDETPRLTFSSIPTAEERDEALLAIIRILQKSEFPREFELCMNHKSDEICSLPENSKLAQHTPFYDQDLKVLRAGGRTQECEFLSPEVLKKIIVPDCQFAVALFRHVHLEHRHPPQLSLRSFVRQRFCTIHDTKIARKVTRSCLTCFRHIAKCERQIMAPLPYDRVNASFPFAKCAVDYSGYYELYASLTHHGAKMKFYVAMFKCMQTGAVHLELATSMSTESFFDVLDRMGSRRGYPSDLYLDNGTNFTGADKELKEIWNDQLDEINEYAARKNIKFHFTTPGSSHAGGIYESGIKSYKHYLRRAMGDEAYDYHSFTTLLSMIEADMNSRPLLNLSNDPNDIHVLTPGHFLIGRPMNSRPTRRILPSSESLKLAHDRVQRARRHFWNEWYMHYLDQLQTRPVEFRTHVHYEVGQAVVVREKNVKPRDWKIGCIIKVFKSKRDQVIRNVRIRLLDKTEFDRHVRYIALLPGESA